MIPLAPFLFMAQGGGLSLAPLSSGALRADTLPLAPCMFVIAPREPLPLAPLRFAVVEGVSSPKLPLAPLRFAIGASNPLPLAPMTFVLRTGEADTAAKERVFSAGGLTRRLSSGGLGVRWRA